jgi:hypothetical protein
MDTDKRLKIKTQEAIQSAMREFNGGEDCAAPKNIIDSANYHKLDRRQIDQGVIALLLQLNLSGGSVGNVDLYRLIRTYLWDESARVEMNKIVDKLRLS